MEPNTILVIAVFLSPYLIKAGEKVSEKIVEELFNSRKDIADKFRGLFKSEIIALDLNEYSSSEEITKLLEANPEVKEEIRHKITSNQNLMDQLTDALSRQTGRIVTSKIYIKNIEYIDTANFN